MLCLKGFPKNINNEYLMKVKKIDYYQKNGNNYFVYSLSNSKGILRGKSKTIYITNFESHLIIPKSTQKAIIYSVNNIDNLNIGDVVLINPEGEIVVLYERNSDDNSIFVTQDCNCNCIMCPQPRDDNENDLTPYNLEIIRLIDKSTRYLALTGGEPTLYQGRIVDILENCKKFLPKTSIIILTNGVRFSDFDFAKTLLSTKHPDLTFAISLQADIDQIHNNMMGRVVFDKTINGIYNLAKLRQKIEIRIVVTKLNYCRLKEFTEFVSYNFPFIYHVAIMGLEPTGKALENIDQLWIDPYYYREELTNAVRIFNRMGIYVSIYNHQLCILPKSIWNFSEKSISNWKNVYLDICELCNYKNRCGGFFKSSINMHSNFLNPIMEGSKTLSLRNCKGD